MADYLSTKQELARVTEAAETLQRDVAARDATIADLRRDNDRLAQELELFTTPPITHDEVDSLLHKIRRVLPEEEVRQATLVFEWANRSFLHELHEAADRIKADMVECLSALDAELDKSTMVETKVVDVDKTLDWLRCQLRTRSRPSGGASHGATGASSTRSSERLSDIVMDVDTLIDGLGALAAAGQEAETTSTLLLLPQTAGGPRTSTLSTKLINAGTSRLATLERRSRSFQDTVGDLSSAVFQKSAENGKTLLLESASIAKDLFEKVTAQLTAVPASERLRADVVLQELEDRRRRLNELLLAAGAERISPVKPPRASVTVSEGGPELQQGGVIELTAGPTPERAIARREDPGRGMAEHHSQHTKVAGGKRERDDPANVVSVVGGAGREARGQGQAVVLLEDGPVVLRDGGPAPVAGRQHQQVVRAPQARDAGRLQLQQQQPSQPMQPQRASVPQHELLSEEEAAPAKTRNLFNVFGILGS